MRPEVSARVVFEYKLIGKYLCGFLFLKLICYKFVQLTIYFHICNN